MWEAWENSLKQAKSAGHNAGHIDTLLSNIRHMIKNLQLSPEKAMDALEVPQGERPALLAAL